MKSSILPTAILFVMSVPGLAGDSNSDRDATSKERTGQARVAAEESAPATQPAPMPSLIQKLPDYSGDFWRRSYMTGDWGGARTGLAEKGVIFELELTQVLQGNAHGGKDTNNGIAYSGSVDYALKLDTARMGLWPGGLFTVRAATQFGHSINRKVGSIMPPNFDALLPLPDDSGLTTLSEAYLTQALSEKLLVVLGKADGATVADMNEFAYSEKTQFLNLGLRANPVLLPFAPYTVLTAAAIYKPIDSIQIITAALDTNGLATRTGFDTWFHSPEGTSVLQEWTFDIKPFDLPGHQRFGLMWSSKDFNLLSPDLRIGRLPLPLRLRLLRGPGVLKLARAAGIARSLGSPDTRPDDWCFYYNFDQYLYTEPEDPKQGFGLFGRFGWSSGEANPIETFYSIGVGGKGIIPGRDNDGFGIGYYYVNMSDDLPGFLGVHAEQGVELYYNIEVTPWLHITPDLQLIVNPGGGDRDVAVAYGLRAQMSF